MERDQKNRLVSLTFWGRLVIDVSIQDSCPYRLVLRAATIEEKARSAVAYECALAKAKMARLTTEAESLRFRCGTGEWSEQEEHQLEGLQDDIQKMKRGLLDLLFKVEQLEKLRATIRRAEAILIEKWTKRELLLAETAERYAETAQQRYIIGRVTQHFDGAPYWPTEQDFEACEDPSLVQHLVNHYFCTSRLSEGVIRDLARTDPWRSIWAAAKLTHTLFEGPPGAWTHNQSALVRWSHIYDVVYESTERPSEQVIEDDDLLDSWIIRQNEKVSDYAKKRESETLLGVTAQGGNGRQEVFVVADSAGAKRVYEMNDYHGRRIVQTTQQTASARGEVKDAQLPHAQNEIRTKAMEMQSQHVTRR